MYLNFPVIHTLCTLYPSQREVFNGWSVAVHKSGAGMNMSSSVRSDLLELIIIRSDSISPIDMESQPLLFELQILGDAQGVQFKL